MLREIRRWSSAGCGRSDGFEAWTDEVRNHIGDIRLYTEQRDTFAARYVQRSMGPLSVTSIRSSASRAQYAGMDKTRHQYELKYISQGHVRLTQNGRTVELASNSFTLIDLSAFYEFQSEMPIDCLSIAIPRNWLCGHLPNPDDFVVKPADPSSAWVRALDIMLSELATMPDGDNALPGDVVAEQIGGIIGLIFFEQPPRMTQYRRQFARDVIRTIRSHYHCREFTPANAARMHRLSLRGLHALLAATGTTFGKELLGARLAHARMMLADERYRHTSIGEISWLCGFNDPAHFSRRFREETGMPPSALRQAQHPTH